VQTGILSRLGGSGSQKSSWLPDDAEPQSLIELAAKVAASAQPVLAGRYERATRAKQAVAGTLTE